MDKPVLIFPAKSYLDEKKSKTRARWQRAVEIETWDDFRDRLHLGDYATWGRSDECIISVFWNVHPDNDNDSDVYTFMIVRVIDDMGNVSSAELETPDFILVQLLAVKWSHSPKEWAWELA